MNKGFVYLIQAEGTSFYKIGRTENIQKRIEALSQQQSPFELKLVDYFFSQQASKDERILHAQLHSRKIRGEWFNLPEELATDRLWFKPQEWLDMQQVIQYEFDPTDKWMFTYRSGGLMGELDACIEEFFDVVVAEKLPKASTIRKRCLRTGCFVHMGAEIELERLTHERWYGENAEQ
jgi:predicted GIY-YIG superfamily endonuclease